MRTIKYVLGVALFFGVFCSPVTSFAIVDTVKFSLSPETPGPNESIKVKLEAYGIDLGASSIIWVIDGTPVAEGVGIETYTITTKEVGVPTKLDIVITPPSKEVVKKSITIVPGEVDLLWEADTYVPPFYKGKALPTHASDVRFSAFPRFGNETNQSGVHYRWVADRTRSVGDGVGRSSAIYKAAGKGRKIVMGVEVTDSKSGGTGRSTVEVSSVEPQVVFYEDRPLLGLSFERSLKNNTQIDGTTAVVRAVPYFFSTSDYVNGKLLYLWSSGGMRIPNNVQPNQVIVDSPGVAAIELRIRNSVRVMQDTYRAIKFTLNNK